MLDFPVPFRPVMALNCSSKPGMTTRCAYDLKPSSDISLMCMTPSFCRSTYKENEIDASLVTLPFGHTASSRPRAGSHQLNHAPVLLRTEKTVGAAQPL
jgi:hypothetical protein